MGRVFYQDVHTPQGGRKAVAMYETAGWEDLAVLGYPSEHLRREDLPAEEAGVLDRLATVIEPPRVVGEYFDGLTCHPLDILHRHGPFVRRAWEVLGAWLKEGKAGGHLTEDELDDVKFVLRVFARDLLSRGEISSYGDDALPVIAEIKAIIDGALS